MIEEVGLFFWQPIGGPVDGAASQLIKMAPPVVQPQTTPILYNLDPIAKKVWPGVVSRYTKYYQARERESNSKIHSLLGDEKQSLL